MHEDEIENETERIKAEQLEYERVETNQIEVERRVKLDKDKTEREELTKFGKEISDLTTLVIALDKVILLDKIPTAKSTPTGFQIDGYLRRGLLRLKFAIERLEDTFQYCVYI